MTDDVGEIVRHLRQIVSSVDPDSRGFLDTTCANAADALERLAREREWQPIETAPKDDFNPVLLHNEGWDDTFGDIQIGWWDSGTDTWLFASEMNPDPDEDAEFMPTHWQPLPARPVEGSRKGAGA